MRKWVVGFGAVGLVLFGGLFSLVRPMDCPVSRAACAQVKEGMTTAEVERLIGVPAGDHRTRPVQPFLLVESGGYAMIDGPFATWVGDDVELHVGFHAGVVAKVDFFEVTPADAGLLELARWRLGRLKERCGLSAAEVGAVGRQGTVTPGSFRQSPGGPSWIWAWYSCSRCSFLPIVTESGEGLTCERLAR